MSNRFWNPIGLLSLVAVLATACRPSPSKNAPLPFEIVMVPIVKQGESGTFWMGSSDEELRDQQASLGFRTEDERPRHQVTLTVPYAIGKYEVTNEQFCTVMNWAIDQGHAAISADQLTDATGQYVYLSLDAETTPIKSQYGIVVDGNHIRPVEDRGDHPVNDVSWYGAVAFSNFLSEMNGFEPVYDLTTWSWDTTKNGYRLPTEAEWAYAARGTLRRKYAWGDEISGRYLKYGSTCPVGFFDGTVREGKETRDNSSPFGVYDMTGGVWEWVWDWYGRDYYGQSPTVDPFGPESGDDRPPYTVDEPTRVWRGGGWQASIGSGYLRIAKRWSSAPSQYYSETGFRVAQTQP